MAEPPQPQPAGRPFLSRLLWGNSRLFAVSQRVLRRARAVGQRDWAADGGRATGGARGGAGPGGAGRPARLAVADVEPGAGRVGALLAGDPAGAFLYRAAGCGRGA